MNNITTNAQIVRKFLLTRYAGQIKRSGDDLEVVPDNFDLFREGIVDSFGILEMVSALEMEFGVQLDMSDLDPVEMTVLGPLTRYVARVSPERSHAMCPTLESLVWRMPDAVRAAVAAALREGTLIKVREALAAFEGVPGESQGPEAGVQILSSFQVESIEPALLLGLRCIPVRPKLRIAPLNTIELELMNPKSVVYQQRSLANVILWRVEELLPELWYPFSAAAARGILPRVEELQERIRTMVRTYLEVASAPLFLPTLPVPAAFGGGILGCRVPRGISQAIAQFNLGIFELGALDARVHVLDLNWWYAQQGAPHYDVQMDFMAKQPLTIPAAISLGFFLARSLRPLILPRRKVLVVDLDNTLWGGILGEDGMEHLQLGHDFPGNVFLRIQREIRELKNQGVLLVLASKNDEASVRQALEQMPDMLLRWNDFVCCKVDFRPKHLNVRDAAAELGIGLNSVAFLDDSDYEREQMKAFNPEVLILNQQSNALHMLASLLQTDEFDVHLVTQEDLQRNREYELRAVRSTPLVGNLEGFLRSLELRAVLEPVQASNLDRVVQMLGKTNQFNLTTRRHRLEDVKHLTAEPHAVSLCLRLVDKFGDQGIVGVILSGPAKEADALAVDSFLVSCRALGRGIEDVLWAELLRRASNAGVKRLYARYIPTAKNGLVADLYDRFGLKRVSEADAGIDYVLDSVQPIAFPAWVGIARSGI